MQGPRCWCGMGRKEITKIGRDESCVLGHTWRTEVAVEVIDLLWFDVSEVNLLLQDLPRSAGFDSEFLSFVSRGREPQSTTDTRENDRLIPPEAT